MLLQVKNLRCGYGSLEVVHGASLHVCTGEIVGLLGANGAGKSSLLKAIVGLLEPWSGAVHIGGRLTTGQPPWRSISNSTVLVPEGKMIFADMTVRENLLIGGYHNPDRALQMDIVLGGFPRLRERLQQLGGTLSGGEQQMLALARALMSRPRLLLLDEPSMGLAPLLIKEVFAEILKMKDLGLTVLLVEQNAIATLQIADRAYVMETGEITLEGPAADLAHNPEVKRAYLGKGGQQPWRPPAPPPSFPGDSSRQGGGGTNPKSEIRNPKEIRDPKSEEAEPQPPSVTRRGAEADKRRPFGSNLSQSSQGGASFGFRFSDFLRISDFGLRIWPPASSGTVAPPPPSSPFASPT